jgi:5-methylcytosine-specific restriction protein A
MPRIRLTADLPYEVGALYSRREDIHGRLGGQRQGGISTPIKSPFVVLFTGEAGAQHGYHDHWEEENGENILHYYGEGQEGDMQDVRGNRAIREHVATGRRLLLFQSMGKGQPYRFLGEFKFLTAYPRHDVPDTRGRPRKAIIFKLQPVEDEFDPFQKERDESPSLIDLSATASRQLTEIRLKQSLFKRRLLNVEKQCRLTGVADLRFLRASHIKPWARCMEGKERIDGANGLLLTPHADLLFDRGWITFEDNGKLIRSSHLPSEVTRKIGLDLTNGRHCGGFSDRQKAYLEFHREAVFEKSINERPDPLSDLLAPVGY